MRVWLDIDNPPQVQYLVPLGRAFERAGAEVVFTARDYGIAFDLLRARAVPFHPVGSRFAKGKVSKALGLFRRMRALTVLFHEIGQPTVLVSASRPSAAAARSMRIPAFIVCDYEYVHLKIYHWLGSRLLFPAVIDGCVFKEQGFRDSQLIPFRGLKEDITFSDLALEDVVPYYFPERPANLVKVLFRPPAEESHYHKPKSAKLARQALEALSRDRRVLVAFSPRYPWQIDFLRSLAWHNSPVVLTEAIPFLSLLAAVDLVISAGGTMLREAAYIGIPAYSLFCGRPGAVDRYLESLGRLTMLQSADDFSQIAFTAKPRSSFLGTNPALADELVAAVLTTLEEDAGGRRKQFF